LVAAPLDAFLHFASFFLLGFQAGPYGAYLPGRLPARAFAHAFEEQGIFSHLPVNPDEQFAELVQR
jgi:hypothetical protein